MSASMLINLHSRERKLRSQYHTWRIGELAWLRLGRNHCSERKGVASADAEEAM